MPSLVTRGERRKRSIVNRTTALWFIWMVTSLIVADLGTSTPSSVRVYGDNAIRQDASPAWMFGGRRRPVDDFASFGFGSIDAGVVW